jgi:hypothetical protein
MKGITCRSYPTGNINVLTARVLMTRNSISDVSSKYRLCVASVSAVCPEFVKRRIIYQVNFQKFLS